MATSIIGNRLKKKTVTITISQGQTAMGSTGVSRDRIVSVFLNKTDDLYYKPIIYSVYDTGNIEIRVTDKIGVDKEYSYSFTVYYQ